MHHRSETGLPFNIILQNRRTFLGVLSTGRLSMQTVVATITFLEIIAVRYEMIDAYNINT
jgi:hypothetical protein